MTALPAVLAGILALTVGDAEIARRRPPTSPRQATAAPKPCAAPEYRQFDFWLGDWDVTRADGKMPASIASPAILGGCALREEWTGAGGLTGTSLNMYDAGARRWHQTWVDDKGNVLLADGGLQGAKMVLEGDSPDGKGGTVRKRITWSPLDGGQRAPALGVLEGRREDLGDRRSTGTTNGEEVEAIL